MLFNRVYPVGQTGRRDTGLSNSRVDTLLGRLTRRYSILSSTVGKWLFSAV